MVGSDQKILSMLWRQSATTKRPRKTYPSTAGVFNGFCKNHDNSLFSKIENQGFNPASITDSTVSAFRAVSFEYRMTQAVRNAIRSKTHDPKRHKGLDQIKADMNRLKRSVNRDITTRSREMAFCNIAFTTPSHGFGYQACGVMHLGRLSGITLTGSGISCATYQYGTTVIVNLAWRRKEAGYREALIRLINDDPCKIAAIIPIGCNNLYFSAPWWQSLPQHERKSWIEIVSSYQGKAIDIVTCSPHSTPFAPQMVSML
jgi:hypothetical protein